METHPIILYYYDTIVMWSLILFTLSPRFSMDMEMGRLMRDGTAEPASRDQILRRERGKGNIPFPCSADHEQIWQPYPVNHTLAICVTIYTYIHPAGKQERYFEEISKYWFPLVRPTLMGTNNFNENGSNMFCLCFSMLWERDRHRFVKIN